MKNRRNYMFKGPLALLLMCLLLASGGASASVKTTQAPLKKMTVDLNDRAALRNGALYTMHMCAACHSLQGARYSSLPKLIESDDGYFKQFIGSNGHKFHHTIKSNMPPALMKKYVNMVPPDLTDIARRRSPSWLYTYLTSFYVDAARPTGVNNVAFYNVSMPDVFAGMQGLQKPVEVDGLRFGSPAKVAVGVKPLTKGSMTPAQFDRTAKDIVTFLYAVAHPHAKERAAWGPWILGLFVLLSILSFLIYKSFWKEVISSKARWWRVGR